MRRQRVPRTVVVHNPKVLPLKQLLVVCERVMKEYEALGKTDHPDYKKIRLQAEAAKAKEERQRLG